MNICNNATVIIVTYNHIDYIDNCIKSLNNLSEIIVVDNGSIDGTPEFVEENFPQITLIRTLNNLGYGTANNLGVKHSNKDFIVILNPDTKVMPNCLENLLKPLMENDNIVTIPKVLYYDGSVINTCGNEVHITGMAFTRGEGENPDSRNNKTFLNGLSGVCFAISKDNYNKLGGFDEKIFLYMEDTELSWKLCSQGLKILYIPDSVILHDYTFNINSEKIYYVEKGRYIILRKYFTYREFILFSPSFIMTEILTWAYAIFNGVTGINSKLKAIYDGFSTPIDFLETDRKKLLSNMNTKIPELKFPFNRIYEASRKIANFIYELNRILVESLE